MNSLWVALFLFISLSGFTSDKEGDLIEVSDDEEDPPPVQQQDMPHDDSIDAVVKKLVSLQNQPEIDADWLQKIYVRYYFCPTFKRLNGMRHINAIAEEHQLNLRFSVADVPNAVLGMRHDNKAIANVVCIVLSAGGIVVIAYYNGAAQTALANLPNNISAYLSNDYWDWSLCQTCKQGWNYFNGSFKPFNYSDLNLDCSNILTVAQKSIANISAACLNKTQQVFLINDTDAYIPRCFYDGSTEITECNINALKQKASSEIRQYYSFYSVLGYPCLIMGTGAACVLNARGWFKAIKNKTEQSCRWLFPQREKLWTDETELVQRDDS